MSESRINKENLERLKTKVYGLAPERITRAEANILDILIEEKLMEFIRVAKSRSESFKSSDVNSNFSGNGEGGQCYPDFERSDSPNVGK